MLYSNSIFSELFLIGGQCSQEAVTKARKNSKLDDMLIFVKASLL